MMIPPRMVGAHRQSRNLVDPAPRRDAFHTSPQLPQRQYVFSSGWRAVVLID
jgi:hypothetical protein